MTQSQINQYSVFANPEEQTPVALMAALGPYTQRGSTANFDIYYDNSLGTNGQTLADAVLANCEQDFAQLRAWFGGIAAGRFTVYIDPGYFGAYHATCAATEIHVAAFSGTNGALANMLNVAEVDEVMMSNQNAGWNCGASNGEGLSRVLATKRYPTQLNGFASAATWLDSNRPDFVNQTDPSDRNYVSIGCATLFINYLHHQLGFSLAQIVQAGGSTLAATYQQLTGRTDAWTRFSTLLQSYFPAGSPSGLISDNPFPLRKNILFYGPATGTGAFYNTDGLGDMSLLIEHADWRRDWSLIIPGNFGGSGYTDLLFYEPSTGIGEFYTTDGLGGLSLLKQHTDWRKGWSIIIPGNFGGSGYTDLLFYEPSTGTGEFYTTDGLGGLSLLKQYINWRKGWSLIIPGDFSGNGYTDLLFYEPSTGTGEFYRSDGHGGMSLLQQHTNWGHYWSQIVPGTFSNNGYTDLLFYEARTGLGQFYTTDGHGGIFLFQYYTNWSQDWSIIIPGTFGGRNYTGLLFYEASTGLGQFYSSDGQGLISLLRAYTGWRHDWSIIIPTI